MEGRKSSCYICLKANVKESVVESLMELSSYLKVKMEKEEKSSDIRVVMCKKCSAEIKKWSGLYEEMEVIMKKVKASFEVVKNCINDPGGTQLIADPLTSAGYAVSFRRELVEKWARRVEELTTFRGGFEFPDQVERGRQGQTSVEYNQGQYGYAAGVTVISGKEGKLSEMELLPEPLTTGRINQNDASFPLADQSESNEAFETVLEELGISISIGDDKVGSQIKSKKNKSNIGKSPASKRMEKCDVCSKDIRRMYLKRHKIIHTGDRPISCPHCPQKLRDPCAFRTHMCLLHQPIIFAECRGDMQDDQVFETAIGKLFANSTQSVDTDKRYACRFCTRSFQYKQGTLSHLIRIHFQELSKQLKEIVKDISVSEVATASRKPTSVSSISRNAFCV